MTEVFPSQSAEQQPSPAGVEALGTAAVQRAAQASEAKVSIQDLVELHGHQVYADFLHNREEKGPTFRSDPYAGAKFALNYLQDKARELTQDTYGEAKVVPKGTVLFHLKALRAERDSIPQKTARAPYMRSQKWQYTPVLKKHADEYPEIHFANLLRDEMQAVDNIKDAVLISEILIATGRAIQAINQQKGSVPETTDGV